MYKIKRIYCRDDKLKIIKKNKKTREKKIKNKKPEI